MRKLHFHTESSPNLVKMAMESNIEEFLQLARNVSQNLAREKENVGSLKITGRLIKAPPIGEAIVIGDLHGDLESLKHILNTTNFVENAKRGRDVLLIFLGDYGDRGPLSPEVYYIILKLKELFPERVILMRGNHEGPRDLLVSPHDLSIHLNRKFGERRSEAYQKLQELFSHLYIGVLIEKRYVLLHGGVPSQATTVNDIAYAHEKHPRERHLEEILWSDPWEGINGTFASPRGAGKLFGEDVTNKLLKLLGVKVLIRGHESSEDGYKMNHSGKVLTLFSRRGPPYNNKFGAYLHLNLSKKVEKPQHLLRSINSF